MNIKMMTGVCCFSVSIFKDLIIKYYKLFSTLKSRCYIYVCILIFLTLYLS